MVKMEIISKESIKPSSPTPDNLRTFRLSFFDQLFPSFLYFPLVLYYSHDDSSSHVQQAEISSLLKRSLSDALSLYYPFAGRLKDESSVDCGDQGIDCLEARVDAYLSEIIESPRVEALTQFVPSMSEESGGALLGIQLNYFNCGGIAIGVTLCHRITDACTSSMFVKTWAAMARGDTNIVAPSFIASSLFPTKEMFGHQTTSERPKKHKVSTQMFRFSNSKIASLRAEVEASCTVVKPTRVELVTAAIWKWDMDRKVLDHGSFVAFQLVNLRRRRDPPLSEYVLGSLIIGAGVSGNSKMGLGELVTKMREAVGKIDSKYVRELQVEDGFDMVARDCKKAMELSSNKEVDYVLSSWCGFPFYETDFGWGKPLWMSSTSPNRNNIVLMDSISDIGGIEAWISTDEVDEMKFEAAAPNS